MITIDPKNKISEIIEQFPDAVDVFEKYNMRCVKNTSLQEKSLEENAIEDNINIVSLIIDIEKTISSLSIENQNNENEKPVIKKTFLSRIKEFVRKREKDESPVLLGATDHTKNIKSVFDQLLQPNKQQRISEKCSSCGRDVEVKEEILYFVNTERKQFRAMHIPVCEICFRGNFIFRFINLISIIMTGICTILLCFLIDLRFLLSGSGSGVIFLFLTFFGAFYFLFKLIFRNKVQRPIGFSGLKIVELYKAKGYRLLNPAIISNKHYQRGIIALDKDDKLLILTNNTLGKHKGILLEDKGEHEYLRMRIPLFQDKAVVKEKDIVWATSFIEIKNAADDIYI